MCVHSLTHHGISVVYRAHCHAYRSRHNDRWHMRPRDVFIAADVSPLNHFQLTEPSVQFQNSAIFHLMQEFKY